MTDERQIPAQQADRRNAVRREADVLSLEDFVRLEEFLDCVRRDELDAIIKQSVREALDSYQHRCVLHLNNEQTEQVSHLFCAIKEIGHGNLEAGVKEIRDNHKLISRYCRFTGKIGTTTISFIIFGILAILGSTFVIGVVERIKAITKP
jgi:hypothetical protein